MRRDARDRTAWAGARFAGVVACAGALTIVSDGQAAAPVRQLDPKTGLPQTWNSQVGVSPPPIPGSREARPPHMVRRVLDPCKQFDRVTKCADPTFLTQCPKDATACSSGAALDACKGQTGSAGMACMQAFFQKQQAQAGVSPVRRVVPSRRSLATAWSSTTYVPYDRSKVTVSGMDHSFSSRLASAGPGGNAPVPAGGHAPHVTDMQAALKKLPNSANTLIQSCDEYGARKYMSLTLFDQEVNSLQRDPRKVYDLIFNSSKWASIVQKAQVLDSEGQVSTKPPRAYMDEAGNVITPKPGDLKFKSVPGARNQFLQLASTLSVPTALPLPDFTSYPGIAPVMAQYQKTSGVFLNQQLFTQHHFTTADNPMVSESFDWHRQQNGALREQDTQDLPGKFTDEELAIRYAKQKGLRNLLAQRNELTHFMANVSSICRKKAKPAPIPQPPVGQLTTMAGTLMKLSALDPEMLTNTPQYLTTYDPALMQAGVSKGWKVFNPIGDSGFQGFTAWGPAANNMLPWGMQYQPNNSNGVWVYTGDWRLGAAGLGSAPAEPNPVTSQEVQIKATDYNNQLLFAEAKKAAIPAMEAEQYDAYLQAVADDNAECQKYGISQMFESDGIPYGTPASGTISLSASPSSPPLTRSEQTAIASSFANKVLPQLAAIDALIAEQVDSGIELGCFDGSPNGCDWSPERLIDFVHSYRKEMDDNREADVQRCMLYTTHHPNFTYKAKLNDLMKSKGYDWNKGSRDTVKHFEAFMRDGEAEILKQFKDEIAAMIAMQVYDEDGTTPAIGQVTSTDGGFGGDMFGASYGAGGGYRFGSLCTDPQHATSSSANDDFSSAGNANSDHFTYWAGNFANASVNILGATIEVFNARMDIALTDGHVMDLQLGAGKNNTDGQYLSDYIAGINSAYNTERDKLKAKVPPKPTDRIVQGHMHFRVAGDDIFGPVDKAVNATVYASNERLYSFEPASYDNTFFDESTTFVIVFVPVTLRGWATFHAGIDYTINASVDRPNVDDSMIKKKTDQTPFQLANTIEPYAEVDGNLSVAIGVPGLEVGVKGSLQLIELGLPYTSSAAVKFFNGGATSANQSAGNRFNAKQGLDLTLQTLSGSVSGFVEFLLWTDEAEIFGWNGLTSTTPIFSVNEVNASVPQSPPAVRVMKPGFAPGL